MLSKVLQIIRENEGPQSSLELSQKLGVERSALEGMLEYWVRKGHIGVDSVDCSSCSPEDRICPVCPLPDASPDPQHQLVRYTLIELE